MRHKDYTIWLDKADEDGDYGHVKMCGECANKVYKCTCIDLEIVEEDDDD